MEMRTGGSGNWKLTKYRIRQYLMEMNREDREKMTNLWKKNRSG